MSRSEIGRAACAVSRALCALFVMLLALTALASAGIQVNKAFSPNSVALGANSTVTVTLQNDSTSSSATITAFSDDVGTTMAGHATLLSSPAPTTTCSGGTPTIAGQILSMNNGTIPIAPNASTLGSCTIIFTVKGAIVGNGFNTIAAANVVTSLGSPAADVTQTLAVQVANVTASASSPGSVQMGGTNTVTYVITNPAAVALTNVAFPITSNGASSYTVSNATTTCGGTGSLPSPLGTTGTTTFSGLTIPASGTCSVTLSVTAAAAETVNFALAASSVSDDQGATNTTGVSGQAVFVSGKPNISKSFSPTAVAPNGTSTLTITVQNVLTDKPLTNAAFSDILPTGLTLSSTPVANGNGYCGSPVLGGNGTGTLTFSGGTITTNKTCTITASVTTGSTIGSVTNTIPTTGTGSFTSTEATGSAASANATLTTTGTGGGISITNTASPSSAGINTPIKLTFGFTSLAGGVFSGGTFSFAVPQTTQPMVAVTSGGIYAPTFTGCGSSSPAVAFGGTGGNTTVTGSNLALTAGGTCSVAFYVEFSTTTPVSRTDIETLTGSNVTFTGTGGNVSPSSSPSVTLTESATLSITNYVASATGPLNQQVTVSGTVNDSSGTPDTNAVAVFNLTAGKVQLAPTPNFTFVGCPGALNASNISVTANREQFTVTIGAISASCTIGYDVINESAVGAGTYTPGNATYSGTLTGGVPQSYTGQNNVSFATTTITVTKAFGPNQIQSGGISTADITLSAPQAGSLARTQVNGVTFSDALPANMTFSPTPNVTFTAGCQQTGQPAPASAISGAMITFTNISLLTVGSTQTACDAEFDVTSSVVGAPLNQLSAGSITSTSGTTNTQVAKASLTVNAGLGIAKTFLSPTLQIGGTDYVRFLITNSASTAALSAGTLVDAMPASLLLASTTLGTIQAGDPALCGGTVAGPVGTGTLTLSGLAVAGKVGSTPSQCVVYVLVKASGSAASGSVTNTIAAGGLNAGGYSNQTSAAGTVTLTPPGAPSLTKTFSPAAIAPNGTSVLSIGIANTASGAAALSGLALTDTLPSGVTIATTPAAATTCASGTVTAVAGGSSVALAGGTVAANATCTITVSVTGSAVGTYANTIPASALTSTQGATNAAAATANLMIASVTVSKAFAPAAITAGASSTLTITIPNTSAGAVALSGVALSDALPSGVTIAATPNASTTCGGTLTAVAGGATVSLTGGSVAANATCTINADVTAAVAAAYTNTIATGALTTTEGISNPSPATANLTVNLSGIALAKAFAPAAIGAGGNSVLTITIPNTATGAVALSGVALTDTLPSGLTIASTPNAATTCGAGVVTATAGGTSVALSGGTVAASATCTISVSVTATAAATYTNTIPISALTTTQGVSNPASATANLTVNLSTITLAKAFAPATIPAGGNSTLTITIPNTAVGSVALTGMALTDTLPTSLTIAATPNATTTCGAGTVTATAGSSSVALSGGGVAANGTCTITVSVTGTTAASYTNTIAANALTTTQGVSNSAPATANLTIALNSIALTKVFAPATIPAGGTSTLTITIPNTAVGAVALTGMALTDSLPSGVRIAAVPNGTTTCGAGTIAATAGGASVALANGSVGANGTCTIAVSVTGTTVASYTNTIPIDALTTTQTATNSAPASASLAIVAPNVTLAKAFAPTATVPGSTSLLTLTINNTAASSVALGGMALTDTYPAGLVNAATPAAATTCPAGTVTAVAGGGTLVLANGTLGANASCTISVEVSAPVGNYTNAIAASALTTTQNATNAAAVSAGLTVATAPNLTLATAFAPASISPNGTSVLSITLTNNGTNNVALSGLTVSDALPAGILIAATPSASTTCGSGSVSAAAAGTNVALSGGTLGAGASCTISVDVTGATPNSYTNTIPMGNVTSIQGASNAAPASGALTIVSPGAVGISKTFAPASIVPSGTSVLTIGIGNVASGAVALSNMALSDALPAGLSIAAVPAASTTCGAGTVAAAPAATSVSLAGGTLAAGASCTIVVSVTGTTPSAYTNTIAAHALTSNETETNAAPASASLTILAPNVTLTKAFAPISIVQGATSSLTLTIANTATSSAALSGLTLSDAYPAGLVNAATPGAVTTCPAGSVTAAAGSATLALANGTLAANASCTVTVSVSAPAGTYSNSIAAAALTTTQGATNAAAATAGLTVTSAPNLTLSTAFTPASIVPNADSTLSITLVNTGNGNVALSGLALSDGLPAGITVAAVPDASTTCGAGVVAAAAAGTSVTLSGGTLPAGASCTITLKVTGASPNTYTNTIAAGNVTSTQGASNGALADATLTIVAPNVALTKAFAPASIVQGATSFLTLTIDNTASSSVALGGLALSDAYPPGLVNAATPGAATTCPAGNVTAAAGSATLVLANGTLAANASCTVTVSVGAPVGTYSNSIAAGALTTTQGVTNAAAATAGLTVTPAGAPTVANAFLPVSIATGAISRLTVTIANTATGAIALGNVALTDALPANVVLAPVPNPSTTCANGVVTGAAGGTSLALSGATLAAGATCAISANVTSAIVATYANTIPASALSDTQALTNAAPATATLNVVAISPVAIAKSFAPATVPLGGSSLLTISLTNTGPFAVALTGTTLSDALPAGMTIAVAASAATTCNAGTVTAVSGSSSIALAGATLAAGASCTFSANVTSTTPGASINTIAPGAFGNTQGATSAGSASATLTVTGTRTVTLAKTFAPASIVSGGTSILTVTIANAGADPIALTALALSDTLPAGVVVAAVPNATTTCGAGTVAASAQATTFALNAGTLAAGATCTLSVTVTSVVTGSHVDTSAAGAVTDAQNVSNPAPAAAALAVTAAPALILGQAFAPTTIPAAATSVLTITLHNTAETAVPLSGVALTDALPAGVVLAAVPNAVTTCPAGSLQATAAAVTFALSGATLAANATCTVAVTVTAGTAGVYTNAIPAAAVTSAQGATNAAATQASLTVTSVGALGVTKTSDVNGAAVHSGQTIAYTIAIHNSGSSAETAANITDVLTNATLVPGSVRVNGVQAGDAVVTGAAPFGSIAAGATVTIVYAATVNADVASGASVSNSATAGGDQGCAGTGCSAAAPPDAVPPPSLAVTLLIDGQTSVIVTLGQIVTYSATVKNVGGSTAQNVTLVDTLPSGVTAVPGSITTSPAASSERRSTPNAIARSTSNAAALTASNGAIEGQTVTASLGNLAPGASATMTFRATITAPIKGFVANIVTVGAAGIPSVVKSNTVVARMVAATLNVTKTTGASVVETGDRVDYAVQISAPAGIAFGQTTIVDQLPDYLSFAPGTARVNGIANNPTVSGHRLTWTIPALHGEITLTYATAVSPGAPPNTTLDNLVTVSSAPLGTGPAGGGSASAAVQVAATAFGNCYPITGRVYDDLKHTGSFESGDAGLSGVRIVLDDGESAVTDAFGRYDFPCVRPGMHALRLDEETLPPGNVPYDDRAIDSERSTRRLVHSTFDSTIIQDINFAVTQRKD